MSGYGMTQQAPLKGHMHRIRQPFFILKNIYINQKTKLSLSTFLLQKKQFENMKKAFGCKFNIFCF